MPIKRTYKTVFSENFFNKEVNEQFVINLMKRIYPNIEWTKGNPDKFEPDFISNELPLEITLASDSKYIYEKLNNKFKTDDIESAVCEFIRISLDKKSTKNYSTPNVNVAVIVTLPTLFDWYVRKTQGGIYDDLVSSKIDCFINEIDSTYIKSKKFENIFLINLAKYPYSIVTNIKDSRFEIVEFTQEMENQQTFQYFQEIKTEIIPFKK